MPQTWEPEASEQLPPKAALDDRIDAAVLGDVCRAYRFAADGD